jgi:hypothetical protein
MPRIPKDTKSDEEDSFEETGSSESLEDTSSESSKEKRKGIGLNVKSVDVKSKVDAIEGAIETEESRAAAARLFLSRRDGAAVTKDIRRSPDFARQLQVKGLNVQIRDSNSIVQRRIQAIESLEKKQRIAAAIRPNIHKKETEVGLRRSLERVNAEVILKTIPQVSSVIEAEGGGLLESMVTSNNRNLVFEKKLQGGNNADVYMAHYESEPDVKFIVKIFPLPQQDSNKRTVPRILETIRRENNNLHIYGLKGELFTAKLNEKSIITLIMPQFPGIPAKRVLSFLATEITESLEKADFRKAFDALRTQFIILDGILKRIEDYHTTGFVHGDAWMDNFIINKKETGDYDTYLIDFGACCQQNISANEYLFRMQKGVGDTHTAPEIPNKANIKATEFDSLITTKSDLHAIAASFIFDALLDFADGSKITGKEDPFQAVVKEFLSWAMTYACNSNWFCKTAGITLARAAMVRRNAYMHSNGIELTAAARVSVPEAIAKIESMIQIIDAALEKERLKM